MLFHPDTVEVNGVVVLIIFKFFPPTVSQLSLDNPQIVLTGTISLVVVEKIVHSGVWIIQSTLVF